MNDLISHVDSYLLICILLANFIYDKVNFNSYIGTLRVPVSANLYNITIIIQTRTMYAVLIALI